MAVSDLAVTLNRLGERLKPVHLLALCGILILARWPQLLVFPRFWAEEGEIYYRYAWHHGFWHSLLHVQFGYFALYNNIVSILATWVDVENAPLVTTYASALVLLTIGGLVATSRSTLWVNAWQKPVVIVLIFAIMSFELWLNVITTQFHFGLIAGLILLEDSPPRHARKWFFRLLLVMAALTGAVAAFLAPVFLLKAWRTREREFVIQALLLSLLAAIQLAIVLDHALLGTAYRMGGLDLTDFVRRLFRFQFYWGFAFPVKESATWLYRLIGLGMLLLFVRTGYRYRHEPIIQYLYLAIGLVCVLSLAGSLGMRGGPRYAYAGSALIAMAVVYGVFRESQPRVRLAGAGVLALSLGVNLFHYYVPATYPLVNDWSDWRKEVARWREDPDYAMKTWPQFPGGQVWKVKLEPKTK